MKDLTGNFYTTEHNEDIIEFIEANIDPTVRNFQTAPYIPCTFLEWDCAAKEFFSLKRIALLANESVKLNKQEFMVRIGMVAPEEQEDPVEVEYTFEDTLNNHYRELDILKAENQMFKDNIKVLKEHINLLQERLDVAQNNCKMMDIMKSGAEQHNYITAKKFNDTLAENHKLREQIKQLENK